MKRLSNRQEQVMAIIWEHGPMTVSRLIPLIDDHLHFNTISTVVRELDRIGFLSHNSEFRPFLYYPKITKNEYISELIISISTRFFDCDKMQFAKAIDGY
ncbi:MAG: BlaI/MecI/CopY family transcriptional regulator [Muribaculaceae bacterium]|nr:BlaI/MecI/CopY family transcriptional regulator [Muribaculaceae bacterium]